MNDLNGLASDLDGLEWRHYDGLLYDRRLGALNASACYGGDDAYRYMATYQWQLDNPRAAVWVMLNPSTATERQLDPTLRRCLDYSRRWGYGAMHILNLYAYRSTDPRALSRVADPVGPANDYMIRQTVSGIVAQNALVTEHVPIYCGWGGNGPRRSNRPRFVWELIRHAGGTPHVLGVGSLGFPKHPLYLHRDLTPFKPDQPPPTRTDIEQIERERGHRSA